MTRLFFSYTGLMKTLLFWLCPIFIFFSLSPPVQAQGGCPAEPDLAPGAGYTVIQAIPLTPYLAEATSTQLDQSFYENTVEFTFDPTTSRALLAGSPNGQGQLCTDDLLAVFNHDWTFSIDYRSADQQRIVVADPIDISYMLSAGNNWLMVQLVDLAPSHYSSSPLWLVLIESSKPVMAIPATNTPQSTPTPLPTASATPTATPTPPMTITLRFAEVPQLVQPPNPPPDFPTEVAFSRWLMGMLLGLVAGTLAIFWFIWRHRIKPVWPVGEVKVYRDSTYDGTYPLTEFRKPIVTVGRAGDIGLADHPVADYVAQFRATRNEAGEIETLVEYLAPENPKIVMQCQSLRHGDQLQFGPFALHYFNYGQETTLMVKGTYSHV